MRVFSIDGLRVQVDDESGVFTFGERWYCVLLACFVLLGLGSPFLGLPVAWLVAELRGQASGGEGLVGLQRVVWWGFVVFLWVGSSLLFGIWHILPAHDAHTANRRPVTDDAVRFASAPTVLATVAATTAAGCGLAWLRLRSGSVLAPTVVHAAVNIGAFVAVRAQITLRGR